MGTLKMKELENRTGVSRLRDRINYEGVPESSFRLNNDKQIGPAFAAALGYDIPLREWIGLGLEARGLLLAVDQPTSSPLAGSEQLKWYRRTVPFVSVGISGVIRLP